MSAVTSEDIQGLTSAILKLVEEVSDSNHHTIDVLGEIEQHLDDVKSEMKSLVETIEKAAWGGIGYPGAMEKTAMELSDISGKLGELVDAVNGLPVAADEENDEE